MSNTPILSFYVLNQNSSFFSLRAKIDGCIEKLDGTDNPRAHGKGLTANRSGEWRYRVGDYRILVNIIDDEIIIEVFTIGHRRDIY